MPTSTPRPGERAPGWWPVATVSVLAVTAVLTVLQYRSRRCGRRSGATRS
jgi:hypothetical protein